MDRGRGDLELTPAAPAVAAARREHGGREPGIARAAARARRAEVRRVSVHGHRLPRGCKAGLTAWCEAREKSPSGYPTYTGVCTGTRLYRSITSGIVMRTQPCEALWPIEPYSDGSMPWMPAPSMIPSQRALSGLAAVPPGTTLPRSAGATQLEFGIVQAGFTALFWM